LALFRPFVQKDRDKGKQRNKNKQKKKGAGGQKNKIKSGNTTLSLKTDHQRKMYLTIKTTYVRINQIKLD
jgi:ribosomal protein L9